MWPEFLLIIFTLLWIIHFKKIKKLPPGPLSIPIIGTWDIVKKIDSATEIFFS